MELGDRVEQALTMVGITQYRVERWIGKQCRCPERIENLNQLDRWARSVLSGKVAKAKQCLETILCQ